MFLKALIGDSINTKSVDKLIHMLFYFLTGCKRAERYRTYIVVRAAEELYAKLITKMREGECPWCGRKFRYLVGLRKHLSLSQHNGCSKKLESIIFNLVRNYYDFIASSRKAPKRWDFQYAVPNGDGYAYFNDGKRAFLYYLENNGDSADELDGLARRALKRTRKMRKKVEILSVRFNERKGRYTVKCKCHGKWKYAKSVKKVILVITDKWNRVYQMPFDSLTAENVDVVYFDSRDSLVVRVRVQDIE